MAWGSWESQRFPHHKLLPDHQLVRFLKVRYEHENSVSDPIS